MGEQVTPEDIEKHPWLHPWNRLDVDARIDTLRAKVVELEDNLGMASNIILVLIAILVVFVAFIIVNGFSSGAVTMSDVGALGGLIKKVTGR